MTVGVLTVLDEICEARGAPPKRRFGQWPACVEDDMQAIERQLERLDAGADAPAENSVRHLLGVAGKRLRPTCVALAARTGPLGFGRDARELAVAAELVHAATLLHDDVVDVGDLRRGAPTARVIYGNAASIFGGDWLLVEAIRRIQLARVPGTLDHALVVLRSMLEAESLQLAARGRIQADREMYLRVAQGKTASLFGWALESGARAGGASDSAARALCIFGEKLGLAFQVIDDALDAGGDASAIGKSALTDVREGKMTFPLVVALERDARLGPRLEQAARLESPPDEALLASIARVVRETGAIEEARAFARRTSEEAIAHLDVVPPCAAKDALTQTAVDLVRREF